MKLEGAEAAVGVRYSTGMRMVGVDGLTVLILALHASKRSEPPRTGSYSQALMEILSITLLIGPRRISKTRETLLGASLTVKSASVSVLLGI